MGPYYSVFNDVIVGGSAVLETKLERDSFEPRTWGQASRFNGRACIDPPRFCWLCQPAQTVAVAAAASVRVNFCWPGDIEALGVNQSSSKTCGETAVQTYQSQNPGEYTPRPKPTRQGRSLISSSPGRRAAQILEQTSAIGTKLRQRYLSHLDEEMQDACSRKSWCNACTREDGCGWCEGANAGTSGSCQVDDSSCTDSLLTDSSQCADVGADVVWRNVSGLLGGILGLVVILNVINRCSNRRRNAKLKKSIFTLPVYVYPSRADKAAAVRKARAQVHAPPDLLFGDVGDTTSATSEDEDATAAATCTICLSAYEAEEVIKVLPCGHEFHSGCLDPWLRCKAMCPLCKMPAFARWSNATRRSREPQARASNLSTGANPVVRTRSLASSGREGSRELTNRGSLQMGVLPRGYGAEVIHDLRTEAAESAGPLAFEARRAPATAADSDHDDAVRARNTHAVAHGSRGVFAAGEDSDDRRGGDGVLHKLRSSSRSRLAAMRARWLQPSPQVPEGGPKVSLHEVETGLAGSGDVFAAVGDRVMPGAPTAA